MNWNKRLVVGLTRIGLLCLCVGAGNTYALDGDNLLWNGSFELLKPFCRPEDDNEAAKPFRGWDAAGGWHTSLHVGSLAIDGDVSVLFTGGGWISQYAIPVKTGKTYRVSGWIRTDLPVLPSLPTPQPGQTLSWSKLAEYGAVIKIDAAKSGTLWARTVSGTQPWHQVTGTFVVPAGVKHLTLTIGGYRDGGAVWADNFSLNAVGTITKPTLEAFMETYQLEPVRGYTFLGTENSVQQLWGSVKKYNKPTVHPDGLIEAWFNPGDHVAWVEEAMTNGTYTFGLVDGYLPAVRYVYRQANTDRTCEMVAFAVDSPNPGSIFIPVALVEKEGGKTKTARYFKLGSRAEDITQANFDVALQGIRQRWETFFDQGTQFTIPDPDVENACKASLIRALITFTGKRPHYGVRRYGPNKAYGPEDGDGFPPTIIALVDCLLDWEQNNLARAYLAVYFDTLVREDGRVRYYIEEKVDGCSVAEYGQLLWLVRKCMDAGGSKEWFERLRPKLERIRATAWDAAARDSSGMIAGCGEADLRKQVGIYFHNNGWMWRGLRDIAPLLGHPGELERCEGFRKTVQAAIEQATNRDVTPMFIPPMPAKTLFNTMTPFKRMTENNFVSYTNYRYWPELLSSGILTKEQAEAIIAYRKAHRGEIAGLGRIWGRADNWPIAEYATALHELGRTKELRRILFSHLAGHMTPETWTAYEQVAIEGSPYRQIKADYCVPAQLVAPRLAAWLWKQKSAAQTCAVFPTDKYLYKHLPWQPSAP